MIAMPSVSLESGACLRDLGFPYSIADRSANKGQNIELVGKVTRPGMPVEMFFSTSSRTSHGDRSRGYRKTAVML